MEHFQNALGSSHVSVRRRAQRKCSKKGGKTLKVIGEASVYCISGASKLKSLASARLTVTSSSTALSSSGTFKGGSQQWLPFFCHREVDRFRYPNARRVVSEHLCRKADRFRQLAAATALGKPQSFQHGVAGWQRWLRQLTSCTDRLKMLPDGGWQDG